MPYSYSDIVYILNIIPKRDKPELIKCIVDISNNTTDDKEKNSNYVYENWNEFIKTLHKKLYQPDPNLRSSVPWGVLQEDEVLIEIEKLIGMEFTHKQIGDLQNI
ncbi:MAG: hypothetical protein ACJ0OY_06815 [Dehalococcoidia bacterium]